MASTSFQRAAPRRSNSSASLGRPQLERPGTVHNLRRGAASRRHLHFPGSGEDDECSATHQVRGESVKRTVIPMLSGREGGRGQLLVPRRRRNISAIYSVESVGG